MPKAYGQNSHSSGTGIGIKFAGIVRASAAKWYHTNTSAESSRATSRCSNWPFFDIFGIDKSPLSIDAMRTHTGYIDENATFQIQPNHVSFPAACKFLYRAEYRNGWEI
jgi:hypothetical protein